MRLRNKKTGGIDDVSIIHSANKIKGVVEHEDGVQCLFAYTLKEFNEEWEDVREEPKEYWYINGYNEPEKVNFGFPIDNMESLREIGFLFGSKEETELAIRKLKAFTELCKKGFEFDGVEVFGSGLIKIEATIPINEKTTLKERSDITDSLYLLFGGEE